MHRRIQKIQGPLSLGQATIGTAEVSSWASQNLRCTFCLSQCTSNFGALALGAPVRRRPDHITQGRDLQRRGLRQLQSSGPRSGKAATRQRGGSYACPRASGGSGGAEAHSRSSSSPPASAGGPPAAILRALRAAGGRARSALQAVEVGQQAIEPLDVGRQARFKARPLAFPGPPSAAQRATRTRARSDALRAGQAGGREPVWAIAAAGRNISKNVNV